VTPIDFLPGTLQLNVWATDRSTKPEAGGSHSTATIVLPGLANLGGGQITFNGLYQQFPLTDISLVPVDGAVFRLEMKLIFVNVCSAILHLFELPDGSVDVRGNSDTWCFNSDIGFGPFVVEGVGDRGIARLLHR
jgi:hypothetical protein